MTKDELVEQALSLPLEQRIRLLDALLPTRADPSAPTDAQPGQPDYRPDPGTLAALAVFRAQLAHRFGERLRGLVLFGSRARGDHRPDSDVDVAVFLDPVSDPVAAQMDSAGDAYLVFLERGLLIQPWVFRGTPDEPDRSRASRLLAAVRSEGIPL